MDVTSKFTVKKVTPSETSGIKFDVKRRRDFGTKRV